MLGFPSSGLLGTFSISYLVRNLKMQLIGEIENLGLLPTLFIENGEILGPIRIYKRDNLFVIVSDLPVEPDLAYDFAESILKFCKKKKIGKTIMVSGLESLNNDPLDCKVFGLVTHQSLEAQLYEANIPKLLSGTVFGTDAAILSSFRKSNIPAMILLSKCHPFFPEPGVAVQVITLLSKILKVKIDTHDIQKNLEYLRIQHRNLMQETINSLQEQQEKKPLQRPPHIYR